MFNAKYRIRLKKDIFIPNYAACLGEQLLQLLNFIENLMPPQVWYGANIDTSIKCDYLLEFSSFALKKIGDISLLKQIAKRTDQFLSGVFIAVKKENLIKEYSIEIDTEDPEFRSLNIKEIIIEIRAFDKSCFELYSDDYELIKKISVKYNSLIQKSPYI